MAAMTTADIGTNIVINDFWYEGEKPGSKQKVVDVTLILNSQGGLTNNIPASLLGFQKITQAWGFRDASSVARTFGPNLSSSLNGTLLVAYTVETNGSPADVGSPTTFRGYVKGVETSPNPV
jgi:hypothetical protein